MPEGGRGRGSGYRDTESYEAFGRTQTLVRGDKRVSTSFSTLTMCTHVEVCERVNMGRVVEGDGWVYSGESDRESSSVQTVEEAESCRYGCSECVM